jgi:hypothetical protein
MVDRPIKRFPGKVEHEVKAELFQVNTEALEAK